MLIVFLANFGCLGTVPFLFWYSSRKLTSSTAGSCFFFSEGLCP